MRKIPPPVWAAVLFALAVAGMAALPSSMPDRANTTAVVSMPSVFPSVDPTVSPGVTWPSTPAESLPSQEPPAAPVAPCVLSPQATHDYARHPASPNKAGPGSRFKESRNAFGPSAVPANWQQLTPAQRLNDVRREFLLRHCGNTKIGGDKKLFQVGYPGLDVSHLARAATHPTFDPNRPISRTFWQTELTTYLGAIRWDKSYLTYEKLGPGTWTLYMRSDGTGEPVVRAVKHRQPKSHYLMLAVTQPDGSVSYERRRLECGFQTTYNGAESVPVALK